MDKNLIFICQFGEFSTRFYVKVISEIQIIKCSKCQKVLYKVKLKTLFNLDVPIR